MYITVLPSAPCSSVVLRFYFGYENGVRPQKEGKNSNRWQQNIFEKSTLRVKLRQIYVLRGGDRIQIYLYEPVIKLVQMQHILDNNIYSNCIYTNDIK